MEHLWVDACPPMRADEPCCSSFWYPTSFWKAALATGWRQLDYLCATQCEWVYQNLAGEKAAWPSASGRVWGWGLVAISRVILSWRMKTISSRLCVKGWLRRCVGRTQCIAPCCGNWKATVGFQTIFMVWKPGTAIAAWFFALSTRMGVWDQMNFWRNFGHQWCFTVGNCGQT